MATQSSIPCSKTCQMLNVEKAEWCNFTQYMASFVKTAPAPAEKSEERFFFPERFLSFFFPFVNGSPIMAGVKNHFNTCHRPVNQKVNLKNQRMSKVILRKKNNAGVPYSRAAALKWFALLLKISHAVSGMLGFINQEEKSKNY